ncbi:MAG TPA: GNAT family N-acetyltransferase [Arachnia sp.]|nr:GNAT family N-acetyltransferase [Arachnia sp.]HMT85127.1 GNAT family N-acetyltransferase [Arachnia sp.]
MSWAGLAGDTVEHRDSPAESARFGCRIARVVVGADAQPGPALETELRRQLETSDADLLICRWPGAYTQLSAAALDSGRVVLPADMLVYWEVPAARLAEIATAPAEGLGTLIPEEATDAAARLLEEVITDSFRGYGNHYAANPRLDDDLALLGYVEWALRAFAQSPGNVVLLLQGDTPVGAATLTRDGNDLEIELAGLVAAHQAKGWYAHLLKAVGRHALSLCCTRVIISTQAHNVRVQRAWARAGFTPFGTVTTVHAMTPEYWRNLRA